MKRILVMLLAVLMLVSLTGCIDSENDITFATEPITEAATEPITEPVTEPITAPTEVPATESVAELMQCYISYCGKWESTTQYHNMELFMEGGVLYLDYYCFSGNGTRFAEALASIELSDIKDGCATFTYSDDGWGNSGTLVLDFSQPEQIGCVASITYKDPDSQWAISPGTFSFVRQS